MEFRFAYGLHCQTKEIETRQICIILTDSRKFF